MQFNNLNNSDWQSLVYLTIVLVILSWGLISRSQMKLSKILKYLAMWSAVGFVIVVLYSYRYEFQDFKNRILVEINPSRALTTKEGKILVNISEDGHYYINLKLNGNIVRFMIDTGASDMVLNVNEAKRIGVNLNKLNFNKSYQTANGTSWGAGVIIEKVEIDDLIFLDVEASVNNANMGTSLLGMSFLKRFKKYEFYRDRLELTL